MPLFPVYNESVLEASIQPRWRRTLRALIAFEGSIAAALLAVVVMWPIVPSGYMADDVDASLGPGMRIYHELSIAKMTWAANNRWLEQGRFFPLVMLYHIGVFAAFSNVLGYKLFVLGLIVANMVMFEAFVRLLTRSPGFAALCCLTAAAAFQVRLSFDPILAFSGLMQWLMLLLLVSLTALLKFLDTGKRRYLALSLAAYVMCLLTYEITYPFALTHAIVLWARRTRWRSAARILILFVSPTAMCMAVSMTLRLSGYKPPDAYRPHFDPDVYFTTLGRQLAGALPLSYYFVDPHRIFTGKFHVESPRAMVAVLAATFTLALISVRRWTQTSGPGAFARLRPAVALGLLLWGLPGILIALSPKYQQVICPGMAYIPVYVEFFGVALLIAAALTGIIGVSSKWKIGRTAVPAAALLVALTIGLTFNANRRTINFQFFSGLPHDRSRRSVEFALEAEIGKHLPAEATVRMGNSQGDGWRCVLSQYFVTMHAHKRIHTEWYSAADQAWRKPVQAFRSPHPPPSPLPRELFYLKDKLLDRNLGVVWLAPIEWAGNDAAANAKMYCRNAYFFVRGDGKQKSPRHVWAYYRDRDAHDCATAIEQAQLIAAGPHDEWSAYSCDFGPDPIDVESLDVVVSDSPIALHFSTGFFGPDYKEEPMHTPGRWCSQQSALHILNLSREKRFVRLTASFCCLEKATVVVEAQDWRETFHVPDESRLDRVFEAPPGALTIQFFSDATKVQAPGDPRQLYFGLVDVVAAEVEEFPK